MYHGGGGAEDARCAIYHGAELRFGGGGDSDGGDEYIAEEAEVGFLQT